MGLYRKEKAMIKIEEYRKISDDYSTPEEVIQKRIDYLSGFCRNIAKEEIKKYVREQSITKK